MYVPPVTYFPGMSLSYMRLMAENYQGWISVFVFSKNKVNEQNNEKGWGTRATLKILVSSSQGSGCPFCLRNR